MRRGDDEPQLCLPERGREQVFVLLGTEITYRLMKRKERLVTIYKERQSRSFEQTYVTHISYTFWGGYLTWQGGKM